MRLPPRQGCAARDRTLPLEANEHERGGHLFPMKFMKSDKEVRSHDKVVGSFSPVKAGLRLSLAHDVAFD